MTSRIYTDELVSILQNNLSAYSGVPVFAYDRNEIETLPCILVGIEDETTMEGAILDNFLLKNFIMIKTNGYDDFGNSIAEGIRQEIIQILTNGHIISVLDGLFYTGAVREDGEDSTLIKLNFDAFTHTPF